MTAPMPGSDLADLINQRLEGVAASWNETDVWVKPDAWHEIAQYLRDDPSLDFTYLNSVTGVDYVEYFEMVYHLTSLRSNRSAVIKLDVYDRESPAVPSVTSIWRGADLQEREVWDLVGIRFQEHYNLKRVMLWEEFPGHPLRKDFLR